MTGPQGNGNSSSNKAARPTTADVARLAGVSTATVSYVLNNARGRRISPDTRDAVYRAAKLLGYRPNLAARNLARGKSGVVLYVVPHVAVGEMPMQAGSRMTTALAREGLLQVQVFETDDDQHVVDAIANLDPVAVTSLFPERRGPPGGDRSRHPAHRDRHPARAQRPAPVGRRDADCAPRRARASTNRVRLHRDCPLAAAGRLLVRRRIAGGAVARPAAGARRRGHPGHRRVGGQRLGARRGDRRAPKATRSPASSCTASIRRGCAARATWR